MILECPRELLVQIAGAARRRPEPSYLGILFGSCSENLVRVEKWTGVETSGLAGSTGRLIPEPEETYLARAMRSSSPDAPVGMFVYAAGREPADVFSETEAEAFAHLFPGPQSVLLAMRSGPAGCAARFFARLRERATFGSEYRSRP